jgi:predicted DNA-binding transcriptional regulator YafY
MNRIDRLFAILLTLQSKKFTTAVSIAEKFKISVRTVYRDIRALEESGVPVGFEPGCGYYLVQGFFLPPLSLTGDEANALILMASLSRKFGDASIAKSSESALAKLRNILGRAEKEKAELLSDSLTVWVPGEEEQMNDHLSRIQRAITDRKILRISYTNNLGEQSNREVEPIGFAFYTNQWHLIAWCWKRNEYRDFKVKMTDRLTETGKPFRKAKHWTVADYIFSLN